VSLIRLGPTQRDALDYVRGRATRDPEKPLGFPECHLSRESFLERRSDYNILTEFEFRFVVDTRNLHMRATIQKYGLNKDAASALYIQELRLSNINKLCQNSVVDFSNTNLYVVYLELTRVIFSLRLHEFGVIPTSAHQTSLPCFQYRVPLTHSCRSWLRGYTAGRHPTAE
jgi:hypothetical protein